MGRSQCPYGVCVSPHLSRVQPDGNEPADSCRHGVNYGFQAMLYRLTSLDKVRDLIAQAAWDDSRPSCMANDVALAAMADKVAYYAVPTSQMPGFLQHGFLTRYISARSAMNKDSASALDVSLAKK